MRVKFKLLKQKLKEAFLDKSTPSTIALSASVGFFWNFIPSLGVGPVVSFFTAKLLRGKGVIAVSINLATGFFIPIFYTLNLITGRIVTGRNVTIDEIGEQMGETLEKTAEHLDNVVSEPITFFLADKIQNLTTDFFVGALINGFFFSFLFYILVLLFLKFGNLRKKR